MLVALDVVHTHRLLHHHQFQLRLPRHRRFCAVELGNVAEAPRRGWEASIGGGWPRREEEKGSQFEKVKPLFLYLDFLFLLFFPFFVVVGTRDFLRENETGVSCLWRIDGEWGVFPLRESEFSR